MQLLAQEYFIELFTMKAFNLMKLLHSCNSENYSQTVVPLSTVKRKYN